MPLIMQEVKVCGYRSTLCAHNVLLSQCCVADVALINSPALYREGSKSAGRRVLVEVLLEQTPP